MGNFNINIFVEFLGVLISDIVGVLETSPTFSVLFDVKHQLMAQLGLREGSCIAASLTEMLQSIFMEWRRQQPAHASIQNLIQHFKDLELNEFCELLDKTYNEANPEDGVTTSLIPANKPVALNFEENDDPYPLFAHNTHKKGRKSKYLNCRSLFLAVSVLPIFLLGMYFSIKYLCSYLSNSKAQPELLAQTQNLPNTDYDPSCIQHPSVLNLTVSPHNKELASGLEQKCLEIVKSVKINGPVSPDDLIIFLNSTKNINVLKLHLPSISTDTCKLCNTRKDFVILEQLEEVEIHCSSTCTQIHKTLSTFVLPQFRVLKIRTSAQFFDNKTYKSFRFYQKFSKLSTLEIEHIEESCLTDDKIFVDYCSAFPYLKSIRSSNWQAPLTSLPMCFNIKCLNLTVACPEKNIPTGINAIKKTFPQLQNFCLRLVYQNSAHCPAEGFFQWDNLSGIRYKVSANVCGVKGDMTSVSSSRGTGYVPVCYSHPLSYVPGT